MAIIKNGRINIWNAVKKKFETVHPETETARITDFAEGIVHKLALTSAMTAVTALQKDSWFGNLLKMALTASGVKYNIAQNGYICFGDLFGGLIIQWGSVGKEGSPVSFTFPVAFTSSNYMAVGSDYNPDNDGCILSFYNRNINGCEITGRRISADKSKIQVYGNCIFIGH